MSSVLKPLTCSKCGAPVTAEPDDRIITCEYCGQSHTFLPPPPDEPEETQYRVGEPVAVLWGGRWWPAYVTAERGERYEIHYEGWSDSWDEEVDRDRVRHRDLTRAVEAVRQGGARALRTLAIVAALAVVLAGGLVALLVFVPSDSGTSAEAVPAGDPNATYEAQQRVLIRWRGRWYPGVVVERRAGKYLVSYDEYDASWDEEVEPDRLRPKP